MLLVIKKNQNKPTDKYINILPNWNNTNGHFGTPEQTAAVEGDREVLTIHSIDGGKKNNA